MYRSQGSTYQKQSEQYVFGQRGAWATPSFMVAPSTWNEEQTLQRIAALDSVLPTTSAGLPIAEPGVIDPSLLLYQKSLPVLTLKNLQQLDGDPVRGDIPITFYPEIPIIGKSRFDKDSLRLDGAFSAALDAKYKKLSQVGIY